MATGIDISAYIADRLHSLPDDPGLAIIFPGQGSQTVGMGKDIALRLVTERGRAMEKASLELRGTMAAVVGLTETDVALICQSSGAEPCNYNSPTQIVVGGTPDAVRKACDLAKERGGRGLPIN